MKAGKKLTGGNRAKKKCQAWGRKKKKSEDCRRRKKSFSPEGKHNQCPN